MPNVKRVRQDQEAAAKRYGEYAKLVENYNAQVGQVNTANQAAADLYNQQAAEYNRFVDSVKAGGYGLAPVDGGGYASVHGDVGKGIIEYTNRDEKGRPTDKGAIYSSIKELPETTGSVWAGVAGGVAYVRNADGTATPYQNVMTSWGDEFTGAPPTYEWMAAGAPLRLMEFTAQPPVQQEMTTPQPEEPKGWNPSLREIDELRAPTVDAAGAQMATARGEGAKTGLVNEAAGRDSAFADPEDPTNLADKGILARVLGGQL